MQPSLDNLQIERDPDLDRSGSACWWRPRCCSAATCCRGCFTHIARRLELVLLGALAWCFLIGEIAEQLHLSREMGSLVAGVSLSTFPMRSTSPPRSRRCATLFITLFFVALGMTIPIPACR